MAKGIERSLSRDSSWSATEAQSGVSAWESAAVSGWISVMAWVPFVSPDGRRLARAETRARVSSSAGRRPYRGPRAGSGRSSAGFGPPWAGSRRLAGRSSSIPGWSRAGAGLRPAGFGQVPGRSSGAEQGRTTGQYVRYLFVFTGFLQRVPRIWRTGRRSKVDRPPEVRRWWRAPLRATGGPSATAAQPREGRL